MPKFGRKPAVHNRKTMRSAIVMAAHLDILGAAPTATNQYVNAVRAAVGTDWRMLGNDTVGNCTMADTGHTLMLRTGNASTLIIPGDWDVLTAYQQLSGWNGVPDDPSDTGLDETAVCQAMMTTGFMGHTADATGMIDPHNLDHLIWTIQLCGAVRIGLNFPRWAMDAFNAGQPWDAPPPGADLTIDGGHDVPLVDYRDGEFRCVTWGKEQVVTQPFLEMFCEEAHAELYFDWIQSQGTSPNGLNLNYLANDLQGILQ